MGLGRALAANAFSSMTSLENASSRYFCGTNFYSQLGDGFVGGRSPLTPCLLPPLATPLAFAGRSSPIAPLRSRRHSIAGRELQCMHGERNGVEMR